MGYTVKKGDNPSAIAKANGLTLQQLADYNPKYAKGILSGNINIGDTYNLSKKSGLFNRPQEDSQSIKPGAYYVNYPDYDVQTGLFDGKQRLGHSGVLLVDDNGGTSYYEYGRYDSGIGHLKPGEGN